MFNKQWDYFLDEETNKAYFKNLMNFISIEYKRYTIYPKYEHIFNALYLTDYYDVKVVILGQDPYHNKDQAHGLAFSVRVGQAIPKSLQNIYLELKKDLNISYPQHGNLEGWAEQGVLLLNTVLTVRENQPGSHRNKGWESFTDQVIKSLNSRETPVVFLLWGKEAEKKEVLITNSKHLVLKSAHPSPLSAHRGFFGCRHFSQVNQFLINNQLQPINWLIK